MNPFVSSKALFALSLASLIATVHAADPKRLEYITTSTGGAWAQANSWKNLSTGAMCSWDENSIAVFNETAGQKIQNIQLTRGIVKPYGIEARVMNGYCFRINNGSSAAGGVTLGAGGLLVKPDAINKFNFIFSQAFTLSEDQTWSSIDMSTAQKYPVANVYVGPYSDNGAGGQRTTPESFTMADGKTLTLEAVKMFVTAPGNFANASIYAKSTAEIFLTGDNDAEWAVNAKLNAERITMDGSTLTLDANPAVAGAGQFNVAQTVELKDGGKIVGANGLFDTPTVEVAGTGNSISGTYANAPSFALQGAGSLETAADITVTSLENYTGTAITISAGTLFLPDMIDWPAGLIVTTTGTGVLKLQTKNGYAESRLGGTKNVTIVDDEWKVTDEIVTETELSVDDGKELHIYGNGLTAATTLVLDGGTIIFEDSKTIASPITCKATSTIRTKDNTVVGTLSGFITADDDPSLSTDPARNLLTLSGPGKIVLSGGGLFDHYAGLKLSSGCADVTSAIFRFGSVNESLANNRGGPILVTDKAEWLTIKDGGEIILTEQGSSTSALQGLSRIDVSNGQEGGIILEDSGTLTIENQRYFYIGYTSGRATAKNYLKINGGTLNLPKSGGSFDIGFGTSYGFFEFNSGTFFTNKSLKNNKPGYGKVIWNGGTWKFCDNTSSGIQRLFLGDNLAMEVNGPNCILDISDIYKDRTISCCNGDTTTSWKFGENGALTILGSKTNPTKFKINSVFTDSNVILSNITAITTGTVTGPTFASVGFKEGAVFDATDWGEDHPAEIGTLVIKEGGEWNGGANLDNATFDNLTFENGSILNVTTDETKEISGKLTLPEAMQYAVSADTSAARFNVFSAAGGIVKVDPDEPKKTSWTVVEGKGNGGYKPKVVGNMLAMCGSGSMLLLR